MYFHRHPPGLAKVGNSPHHVLGSGGDPAARTNEICMRRAPNARRLSLCVTRKILIFGRQSSDASPKEVKGNPKNILENGQNTMVPCAHVLEPFYGFTYLGQRTLGIKKRTLELNLILVIYQIFF